MVDRSELEPIGRVWSESSYVALVAVDGAAVGAYRFPVLDAKSGAVRRTPALPNGASTSWSSTGAWR